jgi:hypothetical protein
VGNERSRAGGARPFDCEPDAPLIRPSASDAAAFGILGPQLQGGDDRARRSLGRAVEALNHSLQATRRLIFGLRPPGTVPMCGTWPRREVGSAAILHLRFACGPPVFHSRSMRDN